MTITFRAGDEPATSRREYWQHVAVTALGPLDVLVNGEIDSADRLVVGELGTVRVGQLSAHQSGGARRMARHIRQEDPDFCKIDILARGGGAVVQDGREAVLRPGDFTFVDLSRPAHWRMSPMQIVAVSFPRALLPLRPNDLTRMTGPPSPATAVRAHWSRRSRCDYPTVSTTPRSPPETASAPRCSTC